MSTKTDFLVIKNIPTILSCDGVFRLLQRENKKWNFEENTRSVQNSMYTAPKVIFSRFPLLTFTAFYDIIKMK